MLTQTMDVSGFNIFKPSTPILHYQPVIKDNKRNSLLQYKNTHGEDEGNVAATEMKKPVERRKSSSSRVISSTPIKNLVTLDNLDDFIACMKKNEDKVVVVRFFANWCQTCKRAEPTFFRFARRNPSITFINIPFTKTNTDLHRALNVSVVPYGQIYSSTELVEEMKLTSKNWFNFEETMKKYVPSSV
jgi:thiol-disulfide isomerase/thioredoxin